jgi:hypothetical protein
LIFLKGGGFKFFHNIVISFVVEEFEFVGFLKHVSNYYRDNDNPLVNLRAYNQVDL